MPHKNPVISIGLPVYNGEKYLAETLDSLLAQDFSDFELIVSDNASTDATPWISQQYAVRDKRIRYYRCPENLGAAANYNHTFRLARGRYFKWAPHDDLYAPSYLRQCHDMLARPGSHAALAYPQTILIDERSQVLGNHDDNLDIRGLSPVKRLAELLTQPFSWCHPVVGLIRADVLRQTRLIGGFGGADQVLLTELILRGEFHEVPQRLFLRRVRDGESPHLRANASPEEVAAWFDGRKPSGVAMPETRLLVEHIRAVRLAPLHWREKLTCYRMLYSSPFSVNWARGLLFKELRRAVRKSVWDRYVLASVRRSRNQYLPHRLWSLLSGLKRRDPRNVWLALAPPSERTHAALLEFVATCLSHRSDETSRELLHSWMVAGCGPQRVAAMSALSKTEQPV